MILLEHFSEKVFSRDGPVVKNVGCGFYMLKTFENNVDGKIQNHRYHRNGSVRGINDSTARPLMLIPAIVVMSLLQLYSLLIYQNTLNTTPFVGSF